MNDDIIKMFIDGEEVVCNNKFSIKEEMLSASSAILNNCYPKSWESNKDYVSNFYFPYDYTKFIIGSGNYRYGTEQYYVLTATGENPSFETNTTKELNNITTYGKSTQETTTGKNKFNLNANSTTQGITINGKGSEFTLNGTTGRNTTFMNYISLGTLNAGTYTITWDVNISSVTRPDGDAGFYIRRSSDNLRYASRTITQLQNSGGKAVDTFTLTENTSIVIQGFSNIAGIVFNNTLFKMQIESGTTSTEYEPYTNGPSPNPDYPQEIESVGYENLLNINHNLDLTIGGVTLNYSDNILTLNGTSNTTFWFEYFTNGWANGTSVKNTKFLGLNPSDNYILSMQKINGSSTGINRFGIQVLNNSTYLTGDFGNNISISNGDGVYRIYFQVGNGSTFNNEKYHIQIEKGDRVHSYISYGKYGIEYKTVGKNLFNINGDITTSSDNYYTLTNGIIKIISATTSAKLYWINTIDVETKTYSFMINLINSTARPLIKFLDSNGNILTNITLNGWTYNSFYEGYWKDITTLGNNVFDISMPSQVAKIQIGFVPAILNGEFNNIFFGEKITPNTYEPYQEKTTLIQLDEPLRSLPNGVRDKLRIENNTLYVDRYVGRIILNGSESNWNYNSTYLAFQIPISNVTTVSERQYRTMSSHFAPARSTTAASQMTSLPDYSCALRGGYSNLIIKNSDYTSTTDLKNWLSTNNVEVIYELAEHYTEIIGNVDMLHSYIGQNNFSIYSGLETIHDINYYWKNYDVLFSGIVKNTGKISLNPREPHYCNLQVLDYKTFLSESDSLDFVISNKTIQEAIEMVVDYIKDYGFVLGNIELNRANEVIGAYSTLNQSPYDVLQYLAKISGSVWRTRVIDEKTTAIDFYDIEYLPYNLSILYDTQFFEDNNIVDINFSYGTRDYRNKQIILSNEVYADIPYIENIFGDGYSDTFELQENVGYINSITINGVEQKVITQEEKEIGLDYDFYYTPNKNIIVSNIIQPSNTEIIVNYTPIIKGRQVIYNENEVNRVAMNTETKGVIARYETRNDTLSSNELNQIGQTYIKYKGNAEIILTLKTKDKDLYNIGERIFFDAPINELKQEYMVKSKTIEYIVLSGIPTFFYTYELTSSFNSESAINYFDNQRNKASGNISLGESITRNIDISNNAIIFFKDLTITEITATGDNILNSALNSPFNN